jgi:ABC-type uncharacterized transport system permease subunit
MSMSSTKTREAETRVEHLPPARVRTFTVLTALTSVAILVQAVTAGQFVDKNGADGWVTVHGVIADVSWVLALATAVVAFLTIRGVARRLVGWSAALFVLTLAQTGVGHLITELGKDSLIAVHVPLALVIFGLTIWLTVRAIRLDRAVAAARAELR